MEFLTYITPPVVIAAFATAIPTAFASILGSWLLLRGKKQEVEFGLRQHIDSRMEAYTTRLEKQLESERVQAREKLTALTARVSHVERENEELKRWAAAIRRDLWHVHRYLHAMRMAMTQGDNDVADSLARKALAKLDDMLDESEGLVEDSTPTIDDLEAP